MKILLINTFDRGGAANSAIRLHNGLLNENIESRMLLKIKSKDLHNTFDFDIKLTFINIQVERIKKILNRLDFKKICREKILNNRPNGLELFSFPSSKIDITNSILYNNSEIIHLHWVANFLDWKTFFRKNKKPIVWTLHDENPFLGGEHYDERFLGINEFGNPIKRIKNKNEILTEKATEWAKQIPNIMIAEHSKLKQHPLLKQSYHVSEGICSIPYTQLTMIPNSMDINKVLADCIYDALSICPIHAKHLVYDCENYEIGIGLDYRPTEVVVVLQYGYKKGEN